MLRSLPVTLLVLLSYPMSLHAEETTIVVDKAHCQLSQKEGESAPSYKIAPTNQLTVDARKFDLDKSLFPGTKPDTVQVLIANDRQYSAVWDPSGVTKLSVSTLVPMNDSPRFDGFKKGDTVMLGIGAQRYDQEKKEIVLRVLWLGLIEIE